MNGFFRTWNQAPPGAVEEGHTGVSDDLVGDYWDRIDKVLEVLWDNRDDLTDRILDIVEGLVENVYNLFYGYGLT